MSGWIRPEDIISLNLITSNNPGKNKHIFVFLKELSLEFVLSTTKKNQSVNSVINFLWVLVDNLVMMWANMAKGKQDTNLLSYCCWSRWWIWRYSMIRKLAFYMSRKLNRNHKKWQIVFLWKTHILISEIFVGCNMQDIRSSKILLLHPFHALRGLKGMKVT